MTFMLPPRLRKKIWAARDEFPDEFWAYHPECYVSFAQFEAEMDERLAKLRAERDGKPEEK